MSHNSVHIFNQRKKNPEVKTITLSPLHPKQRFIFRFLVITKDIKFNLKDHNSQINDYKND